MAEREERVFEEFLLVEELGRGGMGRVFRATDRKLGREVALKILSAGHFASQEERSRFAHEARLGASVEDPHLVRILRYGRWREEPFLVMEFIRGTTLERWLARGAPSPVEVLALLAPIARALERIHRAGLVHRDVKPSNILVDEARGGRPVLADFGIARPRGGTGLTRAGEIVGTPAYMSPEQARGAEVDLRTDVYSLGAVLYRALGGRAPHQETGSKGLLAAARVEPPALRTLAPDVAPEVAAICARAMDPSPSGRYQTAGELAEDMERFLAGMPVRARPPGPIGRARKWIARHPRAASAIALPLLALAVLSLGSTSIEAWRDSRDRDVVAEAETLVRERAEAARTLLPTTDPEELAARYGAAELEREVEAMFARRGLDSAGALREVASRFPREEFESGIAYRRAQAASDADRATRLLESYRLDPRGPWGRRALYEIGRLHLEAGRTSEARAALETCLARPLAEGVDPARAAYDLAEALRALGDVEAAASWYDEALVRGLSDRSLAARARLSAALCRAWSGWFDIGRVWRNPLSVDIDRDGRDELLVPDEPGGWTFRVWRAEGSSMRPAGPPLEVGAAGVLPWLALPGREGEPAWIIYRGQDRPTILARLSASGDRVERIRDLPSGGLNEVGAALRADLEGDGSDELLIGYSDPGRQMLFTREQGEPRRVLQELLPGHSDAMALALADLRGSGRPALVVGLGPWQRWTLSVHAIESRDGETAIAERPGWIRFVGVIQELLVRDVDRDGRDEVYVLASRIQVSDEDQETRALKLRQDFGAGVDASERGAGLYRLRVGGSGELELDRLAPVGSTPDVRRMAFLPLDNGGALVHVSKGRLHAVDVSDPTITSWVPGAEASLLAVADLDGDGEPEFGIEHATRFQWLVVRGLGRAGTRPEAADRIGDLSEDGNLARDLGALGYPEDALASVGPGDEVLRLEILESLDRSREALEASRTSGAAEAAWHRLHLASLLGRWDEAAAAGRARGLDPVRAEASIRLASWAEDRSRPGRILELEELVRAARIVDPLLLRRRGEALEMVDIAGERLLFDVPIHLGGGSFEATAEIEPTWVEWWASCDLQIGSAGDPLFQPPRRGPWIRFAADCSGGGGPGSWERGFRCEWVDAKRIRRVEAVRRSVPQGVLRGQAAYRSGDREVFLAAGGDGPDWAEGAEDTAGIGIPFAPGPKVLSGWDHSIDDESTRPGRYRVRLLRIEGDVALGAPASPSPDLDSAHRAYFDGRYADAAEAYSRFGREREDRELLIRAALAARRAGDGAGADSLLVRAGSAAIERFLETYCFALEGEEETLCLEWRKGAGDAELAAVFEDEKGRIAERFLAARALQARIREEPLRAWYSAKAHRWAGRYEQSMLLLEGLLSRTDEIGACARRLHDEIRSIRGEMR